MRLLSDAPFPALISPTHFSRLTQLNWDKQFAVFT